MKSLKKKVVLVGFKGDCAGRHYNKTLIKMALRGKIDLICVDFGIPKNILESPAMEEMKKLVKERVVQYIDLNNPRDIKKYRRLSKIDAAFIATPDVTHCLVARDFLKKNEEDFYRKTIRRYFEKYKTARNLSESRKGSFSLRSLFGEILRFSAKN